MGRKVFSTPMALFLEQLSKDQKKKMRFSGLLPLQPNKNHSVESNYANVFNNLDKDKESLGHDKH